MWFAGVDRFRRKTVHAARDVPLVLQKTGRPTDLSSTVPSEDVTTCACCAIRSSMFITSASHPSLISFKQWLCCRIDLSMSLLETIGIVVVAHPLKT
mmetsp:Transcript_27013/g.84009  ORF Transcript_27013/g.84009 Transcript_27013/m.84009 type:complete len:97 (+) Transcript_27013:1529-1819(+)